jgi:hypothetical protein
MAALLLGACGGAGQGPALAARKIQPDTGGAIAEWLLQLADASPREFLETQAALVAKTPSDVRFRVAYGDVETREAFLKELRLRRVAAAERVTMVRTAGSHYVWLRDLFVGGADADGTPLVMLSHPFHLRNIEGAGSHDQTIAVSQALGAGMLVETPLHLEGGSVVSDTERAFLSLKSAVAAMHEGHAASVSDFRAKCQALWGRPVTLITTAWADRAEHLDLLMMPIGDRRIVMSNPDLAIHLIGQMREPEITRFSRDAQAVARRQKPQDPIHYLETIDVLRALQAETADARRLKAFAQIRRELSAVGYELIDVPFLSMDPQRTGARVVLSYTNVIQDERHGVRTVYMPTYRLPTFDDQAARAWKRCGFQVVRVDAFGPGLNGGALRCLSQVIRRAPQAAPATRGTTATATAAPPATAARSERP